VKRYQVIVLPSAECDIGEAYEWLRERDELEAIRWYNRLWDVIATLQNLPERCPLAPESKFFNREVRQILHGHRQHKYRILYTLEDWHVLVLHVRHGARLRLGEQAPEE
jgi:plasmid stabilization system protein ParE